MSDKIREKIKELDLLLNTECFMESNAADKAIGLCKKILALLDKPACHSDTGGLVKGWQLIRCIYDYDGLSENEIEHSAEFDRKAKEEPDSVAMVCLLYTSPSPRDGLLSRMPSSA